MKYLDILVGISTVSNPTGADESEANALAVFVCMCRSRLSCVCPGRRPTTGSRQKYSAAKTEVASESLPVAPFARPALPDSFRLAPSPVGRRGLVRWRHAGVLVVKLCAVIWRIKDYDVRPYVTVTEDRRYFLC